MDTDRNLLFGVLALQADLLDNDQFAEACSAWAARKETPLAALLVERGWLTLEDRGHVEYLLERKLKKHGDARASLAAVASPEVRRALDTVDDPAVEQSLASLPPVGVHASDLPTVDALPAAGRYRALRPHAKGGLGEVFVAEDTELHRQVALKRMQPHHADDAHSRGRFVLEAEITGGLEHPGIVPVYGLNTYSDGRPFYAMRFIQGESLKDAVKRFHQAPDFGSAAFRQLLRRFVDVCNAVAYAHSRGVLHRDLKPANVMLGPFGETLVVDWGLAKVVGRERSGVPGPGAPEEPILQPASGGSGYETVAGTALGTPGYMSPEQAAGRLDELGPASDVYSLGATLYAVLTGRAPFEGSDMGDVLQQVQRGDFPPPRQVNPAVPPALDAVCRKATALKGANRYPTPLALAADLEHWLADEPVGAHRDSAAVRLVRWGRRHQKLVASGTALLVTAVLALAVGLGAVERERKQTATAKVQAEEHFTLAQQAVDRYLNAVTEDKRLKEQDFFELRKKLLETAVPFYEQLAEAKAGDPQQQAACGRAYYRLARLRSQLAEQGAARADYERARAVFAQLVADHPTVPDYRRELARCHHNLGLLLKDLGEWAEAVTVFHQALALEEQLVADSPGVPEYREALASSHHSLGAVLFGGGKRAEAEVQYRQAIAQQTQLVADCPTVPDYRDELAISHHNLGNLLKGLGKWPEAEAAHRQALALRKQLVADNPTVPQFRQHLAHSHSSLGTLLSSRKRRPEAEAEYRQALALYEPLVADFPTVPDYTMDLGGGYANYANLLRERGEPAASLPLFAKAHAALRRVLDKEPRLVMARLWLRNVHMGRAEALEPLGRQAEAVADWEQALALNDEKPRDGWLQMRRFRALAHAGQHPEAVAAAEEALQSGNAAAVTRYAAACVYALAAGQAAKDAPPNTNSPRAEQYARRAVALLRQAVQQGYKDAAHMKNDADLDGLRQRPDFQQLLAELEAKAPAR
jgi:serine/threonine-protein kinase